MAHVSAEVQGAWESGSLCEESAGEEIQILMKE